MVTCLLNFNQSGAIWSSTIIFNMCFFNSFQLKMTTLWLFLTMTTTPASSYQNYTNSAILWGETFKRHHQTEHTSFLKISHWRRPERFMFMLWYFWALCVSVWSILITVLLFLAAPLLWAAILTALQVNIGIIGIYFKWREGMAFQERVPQGMAVPVPWQCHFNKHIQRHFMENVLYIFTFKYSILFLFFIKID